MRNFNFRSLVILLLTLGTIVGVSACQGEEAVESPVPEEAAPAEGAAAEEAPTEEAPAEEAAGTEAPTETAEAVIVPAFSFTNTGQEEICELYLSPVGEEQWGPDQLGEATIPAGEVYVLQEIPAGQYDVRAVGCEGSEIVDVLDIQPQ